MKFLMIQTVMLTTMWVLMYTLMFKKKHMAKTLSPFECGYNSLYTSLPLSLQFTLVVFMFLLFDIELSILISSNYNSMNMNTTWIMAMCSFLTLMTVSILYEMTKKSIKWK